MRCCFGMLPSGNVPSRANMHLHDTYPMHPYRLRVTASTTSVASVSFASVAFASVTSVSFASVASYSSAVSQGLSLFPGRAVILDMALFSTVVAVILVSCPFVVLLTPAI